MKKAVAVLGLALAGAIVFAPAAKADLPAFNEFKIVGAYGSTTEQTHFNSNSGQIPFLYVQVDPSVLKNNLKIKTIWQSPEFHAYNIKDIANYKGEAWITLVNWNKKNRHGEWEVEGVYKYKGQFSPEASASFVVTPEPLSMVLFGLGGLPIAARVLRRKQQA